MKDDKVFISIRYLVMMAIAMQLILGYTSNNIISVIFICFFIINNQIRVFFLKGKLNYLSIIFEVIVSLIVYRMYSGNLILYTIPAIIDCFIILEIRHSKYILGLLSFGVVVLSLEKGINDILVNIVYLGIVIVIMSYLYRENKKKITAQDLYDRLRVKEAELKEANKNLENYAASIQELTLLKERNRISREIHDSVGHALSTTMIQLSAMERIAEKEGSSLEGMAKYLREFVNESLQDVRIAVKQLKPSEYELYEGIFRIEDLVKNFSKLTGIEVTFRVSKEKWALSSKQSTNIYRIIQEGLSNASRHGKATKIKMNLNFTKEGLVVILEDNGTGCSIINETGIGLKSIRERASELNGRVYLSSAEGEGFKIKIMIGKDTGGHFNEVINS